VRAITTIGLRGSIPKKKKINKKLKNIDKKGRNNAKMTKMKKEREKKGTGKNVF
jgi:hypothetical protein